MKLYVTSGSPYARLARILVIEKALQDRVEIHEAQTRTADSPYYRINPSGRVPYLLDDAGIGMEDSQLICCRLDGLDGRPLFRHALTDLDWAYRRIEASARSFCDGVAVWGREMRRPEAERSPNTIAHEAARSRRMLEFFEARIAEPPLHGPPSMAQLILAAGLDYARFRGLGDLTEGRPNLAAWMRRISALPALQATAPQ